MHNPNNVQVGSQVRFLNTVGGGRVARITADTAWVEDADGFEIPTPLKDCVVVEAGDTFIPEIRPSEDHSGEAPSGGVRSLLLPLPAKCVAPQLLLLALLVLCVLTR